MNTHIAAALAGIRKTLMCMHASCVTMPAAAKGMIREAFIKDFLGAVLPPQFRFGHGAITDSSGESSGQIDIAVEFPFLPSIPLGSQGARLYPAEAVAAVLELKSDIANQWGEVELMSKNVRKLRRVYTHTETRMYGGTYSSGPHGHTLVGMNVVGGAGFNVSNQALSTARIPILAVGYKGWAKMETLKKHLDEGHVDAMLIIENGLFASAPDFQNEAASEEAGLWSFINCLHRAARELSHVEWNPRAYG